MPDINIKAHTRLDKKHKKFIKLNSKVLAFINVILGKFNYY